jgi:hypothetical protein
MIEVGAAVLEFRGQSAVEHDEALLLEKRPDRIFHAANLSVCARQKTTLRETVGMHYSVPAQKAAYQ